MELRAQGHQIAITPQGGGKYVYRYCGLVVPSQLEMFTA